MKYKNAGQILKGKDIIIYGAGGGYHDFKQLILDRYKIKPLYILDKKYNNINVKYKPEVYKNAIVIICIAQQKYFEEVLKHLKKHGFKNIMFANDFYEFHVLNGEEKLDKKNIKQIVKLLEDNKSREVFESYLKTFSDKLPKPIKYEDIAYHYFPADIKMNKGKNVFINCGAYIGDTVKRFNEIYGKVDTIVCFEPDTGNFKRLHEYFLKYGDSMVRGKYYCYGYGLSDKHKEKRFISQEGQHCKVSKSGDTKIICETLDGILPCLEVIPTFINMDIEGEELNALHGAVKIIKTYKPDLAISIYHRISDIWTIPLFLNSLDIRYKFYLRNYTGYPRETVLYATTEQS